jgi:hypothetical protein
MSSSRAAKNAWVRRTLGIDIIQETTRDNFDKELRVALPMIEAARALPPGRASDALEQALSLVLRSAKAGDFETALGELPSVVAHAETALNEDARSRFDKESDAAIPHIDAALELAPTDESMREAQQAMRKKLDEALDAVEAGRFQATLDALRASHAETDFIMEKVEGAKAEFLERQATVMETMSWIRVVPEYVARTRDAAEQAQQNVSDAAESLDWPRAIKALEPLERTLRPLEESKPFCIEYGRAEASIDRARQLSAASETVAAACEVLEQMVSEMFEHVKDGDFDDALQKLRDAEEQTRIVEKQFKESGQGQTAENAAWKRMEELEAKLKSARDQIEKVRSAFPKLMQSAEAATSQGKEVEALRTSDDWERTVAAMSGFARAVAELDKSIGTDAAQQAAALGRSYTDIMKAKPGGAHVIEAGQRFAETLKRVTDSVEKKPFEALMAYPAAAEALAALDQLVNDPTKRTQTVKQASNDLYFADDSQLSQMPVREKAKYALDLCANGMPEGDERDFLVKVFKHSPPDRNFASRREQECVDIGKKVAEIPELKHLFKGGKLDEEAWNTMASDKPQLTSLLDKISTTQAEELGIKPVQVFVHSDPGNENKVGGYNWAAENISINTAVAFKEGEKEKSTGQTGQRMRNTLLTILHETFHAAQHDLVKRLLSGEVGPNHRDYDAALIFYANTVAYIGSREDLGNYREQPQEHDAETAAQAAFGNIFKHMSA